MTFHRPASLLGAIDALGPAGRRRASAMAEEMLGAEGNSAATSVVDPLPVVVSDEEWQDLVEGLTQRARLLDALYADLYGPRTVLAGDVAPADALFADPAYLRPVVGMPSQGTVHLLSLTCTVTRSVEGSWSVLRDSIDRPGGTAFALELRRALSRSAPSLYSATPLHRLHPYLEAVRTSLHSRLRGDGRAGRIVVLVDDSQETQDFDHHVLANLMGAPAVSATDLVIRDGSVHLHAPAGSAAETTGVDAILRMVPSHQVDPLDLGPTPLGGVAGLTEAARRGEVAIINPLGAGVLENPELRAALPDLCRQVLHEDLRLRSAVEDSPAPAPSMAPDLSMATVLSLDPSGGDELVERPVTMQVMLSYGESGYEVLPGGIARTADDGPESVKDIWVMVPETSAVAEGQERRGDLDVSDGPLSPITAMTPSIGMDLFWFGRYLERVDTTARLLRTVIDAGNDLRAERSPAASTALAVLLRSVTDVTLTLPGFHGVDPADAVASREELTSVLSSADRPGSLAQSFQALEQSTLSLRDLVSEDTWPALTRMRSRQRVLSRGDGVPVEKSLTDMIDGCLTLTSAVTETMNRGIGKDLWQAGRRIERAIGLLSLLVSAFSERRPRGVEHRLSAAVATITGAHSSYRRSYQASLQPELLAELLLTDTTLPRSLVFQVERLRETINRLPDTAASSEVRSLLTELRSRVETWTARDLLIPAAGTSACTDLSQELTAARDTLRRLSTALEDEFFRVPERTSAWGVDDV